MLQLRPARGRVERDEDGAQPGAGEPRVDDLEPVLRHDRDAIAMAHAGAGEAAGEARDRVAHLAEGAPRLADAQEGLVAEGRGLALEQRGQRALPGRDRIHCATSYRLYAT